MTETSHWKLNYYSALIYWSKGRIDKAQALFEACQDEPDFVPFYLARADLFKESKTVSRAAVERAVKLEPENWRANLQYAELLFGEQKYPEVAGIATHFLQASPAFGMLYAKALIQDGSAAGAVKFLENYEILPFEGAREGRQIYHQACIQAALSAFEGKDYRLAVVFAEKASLWPRNLGVGKPYDVDNRMEHFILAKTYDRTAESQNAAKYGNLVMQYQPGEAGENLNLIFQALLLKANGQGNKAKNRIDSALGKYPQDPDLKWVAAAFAGDVYILPENASDHLKLAAEVLNVLK